MMMDYMSALRSLQARLATLPEVKTCRIGLEADLSPADYPIVRLVPSRLSPGAVRSRRKMELTIYYGAPILPDGGLDALYDNLMTMERAIIAQTVNGEGWAASHIDTVTDEDRVQSYKLFASRFEIEG